jgi:hypothetical protein
MATYTVSAAGGNFSSTATWATGIVPLATDSIIANASSGNLTIDGATRTIVGANFTGYTGTLAIQTANFNCSGGPVTLGSGMTITTSANGEFRFTGTTTITSNGVVIPRVRFVNTGTRTLADDMYATTFVFQANNHTHNTNGNKLHVTNMLFTADGGGSFGIYNGTTAFWVDGAVSTWQQSLGIAVSIGSNPIVINCATSLTITGRIIFGGSSANNSFIWQSGTMLGDKKLFIRSKPNVSLTYTTTLDANSAGNFDEVVIQQYGPNDTGFALSSNLNYSNLYISQTVGSATSTQALGTLTFSGSGALKGGTIWAWSWPTTNNPPGTPTLNTTYKPQIRLNTGVTHTFSEIYYSGTTSSILADFISASSPTQATIQYNGTNPNVFYTNFTDINNIGNPLYAFNSTMTNSTNILNTTTYVPTSSTTFVN